MNGEMAGILQCTERNPASTTVISQVAIFGSKRKPRAPQQKNPKFKAPSKAHYLPPVEYITSTRLHKSG